MNDLSGKAPPKHMKVLVYTRSWAPAIGGVEKITALLARKLQAFTAKNQRFDVTVLTHTPASQLDDSQFPFRVIRASSLRILVNAIRSADIVHLAGPSFIPLALSLFIGKPVVIEHHGYQAICPNGLLFLQPDRCPCPGYFGMKKYFSCYRCRVKEVGVVRGLLSLISTFPRRWMCNHARSNVSITAHVQNRLKLPHSRVVYYGIEVPRLVQDQITHPSKQPVIAYVGRLVSEKGLTILLEAAKVLHEKCLSFELRFIGDGPERENLEDLTRKLELQKHVTFTGFLSGACLDQSVNEVSAVVMPSVWEETAGLAAIEHMMRGRIVVVADIGGLSEVVGDAGLKFPVGASDVLAERLKAVLSDFELTGALRALARQRAVQWFNQEAFISAHASLYMEVVDSRQSKAGN